MSAARWLVHGFFCLLVGWPLSAAVSISISPTSAAVDQGGTKTFTATVSGTTNKGVTWSVSGSGNGTITTAGKYTAPVKQGTFKVRATSKADTSKYAEATVTVPALSISISPSAPIVAPGATQSFAATVTGATNTGVTWSVPSGQGTITTAGLYTAPSALGTYTVTTTSKADTTRKATASVTVQPVVAVSLTPSNITLASGSTQVFLPRVTGTDNTAVTWTVAGGPLCGWVSASGIYHAPDAPGTYSITATSAEDPSKKATATVTVQNSTGMQVSLAPAEITLAPGDSYWYTAECSGSSSNVTYSYSCTGGAIQDEGGGGFTYTAPATPGHYSITAKVQGRNAQAGALVHVVTPPSGISLTVNPQGPVIELGNGVQFNALVHGTENQAVAWSVQGGEANGTIDPDWGYYRAPTTAGTYTIVASSVEDPEKKAQTTVTVLPRVTVGESWMEELLMGDTGTVSATVEGLSDDSVVWSVTGGSITQDGQFTAPNASGMVKITATSLVDPRAKGSTWVDIPPIRVQLSSWGTITIPAGETDWLRATVTGTRNTAVEWSIVSGGGTVALQPGEPDVGIFYSPFSPGTTVVQAASAADPTKKARQTYVMEENPNPVIREFTATPDRIYPGGSSELRGDFGPTAGTVAPGNVPLVSGQVFPVAPASSTRYELLVAKDGGDPVRATADVGVIDHGAFSEAIPYPVGVSIIDAMRMKGGNILVQVSKTGIDNQTFFYRFDPLDRSFTELPGSVPIKRSETTNLLLQDGRVWILGGYSGSTYKEYSQETWLYDPETGQAASGPSVFPGRRHSLCQLPDGRVLLTGGLGFPPSITWCAYDCLVPQTWFGIYDPASRSRDESSVGLNFPRSGHQSLVLGDGRVLIVGGMIEASVPSLELVDLGAGTCQVLHPEITGRASAKVRPDGLIDVSAGGTNWVLDPAGSAVPGAAATVHGSYSVPLSDGRYLIVDGDDISTLFHLDTNQYFCTATNTPYSYWLALPIFMRNGQVALFGYGGVRFFDPQSPLQVEPAISTAAGGGTQQFQVFGSAAPQGVTWTCDAGNISAEGLWTAPVQPGTYRVTATSAGQPSCSSTAWIEVHKAKVIISAPKTDLVKGEAIQLTATVVGCAIQDVVWSLPAGERAGSITPAGLYTAPMDGGTCTIEATSVADPSARCQIQVRVQSTGLPRSLRISIDKAVAPYGDQLLLDFDAREAYDCQIEIVRYTASGTDSYPLGRFQVPGTKVYRVQRNLANSGNPFGTSWYDPWVDTAMGGYFKEDRFFFRMTATNAAGTVTARTQDVTFLDERAFRILPAVLVTTPGSVLDLSVSARVVGRPAPVVTWTSSAGSITPQGQFTAPAQAGTVTITAAHAQEPGLTATASAVVTTAQPRSPVLQVQEGSRVPPGLPVTLKWSAYDASSVRIDASTGESWDVMANGTCTVSGDSVRISGSLELVPATDTTYTLTATNPNGSVSQQTSVTLVPVQISIDKTTAEIVAGTKTVFTVTSNYNTQCEIEETGCGSVTSNLVSNTNGQYVETFTYTAPVQSGTYHLAFYPFFNGSQVRIGAIGASVTVTPLTAIVAVPTELVVAPGDVLDFSVGIGSHAAFQTLSGTFAWSSTAGTFTGNRFKAETYPVAGTASVVDPGQPGVSATALVDVLPLDHFLTTQAPVLSRTDHHLTRLLNGTILVTGGTTTASAAERYDPASKSFSATGSMQTARSGHAGVLLPDGKVLVVGNAYGASAPDAELFDPVSGIFTTTPGRPLLARHKPMASLLPNGKVLIAGGTSSSNVAELYDPSTGLFSRTGDTFFRHSSPSKASSLSLPDGTVLIASGSGVECYDYRSGSFVPVKGVIPAVAPLVHALRDGRVMMLGNSIQNGTYRAAYIWDPATGSWADGPACPTTTPLYVSTSSLVDGGFWMANSPLETSWTTNQSGRYEPTLGVLERQRKLSYIGGTEPAILLPSGQLLVTGNQKAELVIPSLKPAIVVLPRRLTLCAGASWPFQASATGLGGGDVTWSVQEPGGGTITSQGVYTAPTEPGLYHIVATSAFDASYVATAEVNVTNDVGGTPPVIETLTADTQVLAAGETAQLSWTVRLGGVLKLKDLSTGVIQDVSGLQGLAVSPTTSRNYELSATNFFGSANQMLSISVLASPVSVAVTPKAITLYAGQSHQFGFSLAAPTSRLVWSATGGTVTQEGLYTAPSTLGVFTVTATSVDDPRKSDTATVTVQDVLLEILPSSITLDPGQPVRFGCRYAGPEGATLVWSATGGFISQDGSYTAPSVKGSYTVSVYSTAQPGNVQSASVTVEDVLVQIVPGSAVLAPGASMGFKAIVRSGSVIWSVLEPGGGSITQEGVYTAPPAVGTYTIQAVSSIDGLRGCTAKVTVSNSGDGTPGGGGSSTGTGETGATITLSPANVTVDAGAYYPFQALVEGTEDTGVTWSLQDGSPDAGIDAQGLFLASRRGVYTVVARSEADTTATTTATVIVNSAIHVDEGPVTGLRGYSVTALQDGKILIAGGTPVPVVWDQLAITYSEKAWLYDPETKAYTPTGDLLTARCDHDAVLLEDGRVLIAGGFAKWVDPWINNGGQIPSGTAFGHDYPFAEVYDPATGTFQALPEMEHEKPKPAYETRVSGPGMMFTTHTNGKTLLLADGRVWFSGGYNGWWQGVTGGSLSGSYELFDPVPGLFRNAVAFQDGGGWNWHTGHCVALLDDGRVLGTRGFVSPWIDDQNVQRPASGGTHGSIWDPVANQLQNLGAVLRVGRFGASMTRLADGRFLIVGGAAGDGIKASDSHSLDWGYSFNDTDTAEIFDPATNTSTLVPGRLAQARRDHAAVLLPTGQVMIVGGRQEQGYQVWAYPNDIELYDPETGTFEVMDHLDYGLSEPKLALLPDGSVFVAGQVQPPMEPPVAQSMQKSGLRMAANLSSMNWLVGSALLGQIASQGAISIENEQNPYWITGGNSDTPTMPDISGRIIGVSGISSKQITWQANFQYNTRQQSSQAFTDSFSYPQMGDRIPDAQNLYTRNSVAMIRGGTLQFVATIPITPAQNIKLYSKNINIRAHNPDSTNINNRLTYSDSQTFGNSGNVLGTNCLNDFIQCIALQESGRTLRQFAITTSPTYYTYEGEPVANRGGDGGMGVMQITNQSTWGVLWDWRANIDKGKTIFSQKLIEADRYPGRLAASPDMPDFLSRTNQYRQQQGKSPLTNFIVPQFTETQLIRDGIRGYNGFGKGGYQGTVFRINVDGIVVRHLHQYRPQLLNVPGIGEVIITGPDRVVGSTLVADIVWEEVPYTERTAGEPNYVNLVFGQRPTHSCGQ